MMGVLLVDKPAGITSHDVVDHVRKAAKIRRVGHTGTLDPAATGLLVLCIGKATRLSEHLTGLDKVYEGVMELGVVTDSYDKDGQVLSTHPVPELDLKQIQKQFTQFHGRIEQVPPMVSAVKIGGERLYKKARKGEVVDRPARSITVYEFRAMNYHPPEVALLIRCSSGAYVRGLCHDVGQNIGCGAILSALRRTEVGKFSIRDAATLEELDAPESVQERLLPMGEALDLPKVVIKSDREQLVATGSSIDEFDLTEGCPVVDGKVQVQNQEGALLALAEVELYGDAAHGGMPVGVKIHPRRVFI